MEEKGKVKSGSKQRQEVVGSYLKGKRNEVTSRITKRYEACELGFVIREAKTKAGSGRRQ